MFSPRFVWAGLALALFAAPAPAADKYLPNDTEVVVTFNVRQLLDSPLVKKYGLDKLREALKESDEARQVLEDLGFDPFKDLERVVVAGPAGNDKHKGLFIVHGRFDLAKFKAKAEQAAKDHGDTFKIVKVPDGQGGQHLVYEVTPPGQEDPLFAALGSNSVLFAAPSKEYLVDALLKEAGKKKTEFTNKSLPGLLKALDGKQTLSVVAAGGALARSLPPGTDDRIRDVLGKVQGLGGGVTVEDGVKLEVGLTANDADAARALEKGIGDGLNQALGVLALLAGNQQEIAPVLDFLKSIKVTARDKTVVLRGEVTAEMIEKAMKKID